MDIIYITGGLQRFTTHGNMDVIYLTGGLQWFMHMLVGTLLTQLDVSNGTMEQGTCKYGHYIHNWRYAMVQCAASIKL